MKPLSLREFILSPRFDPLIRGTLRERHLEMAVTDGEEELPFVLPPSEASAQTQAKEIDAPSQGPLYVISDPDTEC